MNRYKINGIFLVEAVSERQAAIKHGVNAIRDTYGKRGDVVEVLLVERAIDGRVGSYRIKTGKRADPRLWSARSAREGTTHSNIKYNWLSVVIDGPAKQLLTTEKESN